MYSNLKGELGLRYQVYVDGNEGTSFPYYDQIFS